MNNFENYNIGGNMNGNNNGNGGNNNFDYNSIMAVLGQTVNITKTNAESTAAMLARLGDVETLVGGITKTINGLSDNVVNIGDRMTKLEQNEEITETQAEILNSTIKSRIAEILGYDSDEIAKYYRGFIVKCYSEMKTYYGMGATYRRTKKRDYQRLIDQIEAWIPSQGIAGLKDDIDERAKANKKAKDEGYIN